MNETTLAKARKIDEIAGSAMLLFEAGSGFEAELTVAQSLADLRAALTPELMGPVMSLMNTDLGFRTDKDPAIIDPNTNKPHVPYSVETVRDCVIEAKLRGFHTIGNEFNIIAGRFYAARNGLKRKCEKWPGVTGLKINVGVPKIVGEKGAIVPVQASWIRDGVNDSIETEIAVRVNSRMGTDAIVGKAERKLFKRIHDRLGGRPVAEADEDDVIEVGKPASKVDPKPEVKPAAAPHEEAKPKAAPTAEETPQTRIAAACESASVTFAQFKAWALSANQLADFEAAGSFADIPDAEAARLFRCRAMWLSAIASSK